MDTDETASAVATATPEPEPEAVAAEKRHAGYQEVMAWPQKMIQFAALAEVHTDMDVPTYGPSWNLSEWQVDRALGSDATDEAKRAFALAWLRRHADGMRTVLRLMGVDARLSKVSHNGRFGVEAVIRDDLGSLSVDALVADALTCSMEPTGEVEEVPAQEATTRPVMRKVCPPSIYADVADDIADPEPEPEPDQPTPTDTDPEAF